MRHWAQLFLLLAALNLSACLGSARDHDPPAVCALSLPKHLQHTSPEALPASVWYQLLFKGYPASLVRGASASSEDGSATDLVDCSGEPIVWAPLARSCLAGEPESTVRQRRWPRGQDELILRHAGGEYWFGWAPFLAFDNGMSEGPLAIARVYRGKLEVRALGTLRAYTRRARLEVRKLGPHHLLVAEGEWCGARATPRSRAEEPRAWTLGSRAEEPRASACSRGTRLLWLDRQRFRERPLRSATLRSCLGPAWFAQRDVLEAQLNQRWNRKLQRDVALAYQDERILVDEHITVNDHDLLQPSLPPRLFREAQAQIQLTLRAGELLCEGQSLWNAIRVEDGATELRAGPRALP